MEKQLEFMILGTRGSCAAPLPDRMKYGGNTSCAALRLEDTYIVFDAGTGILRLGEELQNEWKSVQKAGKELTKKTIALFLGHVHFDHVIALPLFVSMVSQCAEVTVYGEDFEEERFERGLQAMLGRPGWPLMLGELNHNLKFCTVRVGSSVELPYRYAPKVTAYRGNHPGRSLLYTVEWAGYRFCYGLDHEFGNSDADAEYEKFAAHCDLLVFDGTYTEEDYVYTRDFGHGFWQQAMKIAEDCGVRKIGISHYDWRYTDSFLEEQEKKNVAKDERILFLREGMKFEFQIAE